MKKVLLALGNEERLKMTYLLTRGSFCQKHFEKILNVSQSNSSRNLKKLVDANIINYDLVFCKNRYYITDEFKESCPEMYSYVYKLYDDTNLKEESYDSAIRCNEMHKLDLKAK